MRINLSPDAAIIIFVMGVYYGRQDVIDPVPSHGDTLPHFGSGRKWLGTHCFQVRNYLGVR
jgi:hypothetical protein